MCNVCVYQQDNGLLFTIHFLLKFAFAYFLRDDTFQCLAKENQDEPSQSGRVACSAMFAVCGMDGHGFEP